MSHDCKRPWGRRPATQRENRYYSAQFMVLKDGPIKKIKDLKGKIVAVNVKFGATYGAVRSMLANHGLSDGDYTVLEVAFSPS